jgi:hypothetical protein
MWPARITSGIAAELNRAADGGAEGDEWINDRMQIVHSGPS